MIQIILALVALGADTPGETAYVHPAMYAAPASESHAEVLSPPEPSPSSVWEAKARADAQRRLDRLLGEDDSFLPTGTVTAAPFLTERERSAAAVVERMNRAGTADSKLQALELGTANDPAETLQLILSLAPDNAMRRQSERALESMEPSALAAGLLELLAATPADRRPAMIEALPILPATLQDPLLEILRDEDPSLPRAQFAAQCLGQMVATDAVPLLAERTWNTDPAAAYAYAYALWLTRAPAALPEWHRLMTHPEPSVRALAQEALISMGGEAEVTAVYDAASGVTEQDVDLQIRAVQWLGTLNEPFLIPLLVEVMEKNRYIRDAAGQILRHKTGATVENDPAKWREWMKMVEQMNTPLLVPSQAAAPQ